MPLFRCRVLLNSAIESSTAIFDALEAIFSVLLSFSSSMMSEIKILFSIGDKYQLCLICSFLFYHLTKILQIENFLYIHNALQASDDCRSRWPGVNRSNQLLNRQYFNLFIGEMGLCTQERIRH